MTIINPNTFVPSETDPAEGTIEITLRGETRRVQARRYFGGFIAFGVTGRYSTGTKAWPAHIILRPNGVEYVNFGRDDRHPKFRKENCIFFAEK